MASQGGRLTTKRYQGKAMCEMNKCTNKARWYYTCSPNFFELYYGKICTPCRKKCMKCTARNVLIKSALD